MAASYKETLSAAKALGNRNLSLFFIGNGISLCGIWMHKVAVNWLIYKLTGSAFMLGMVNCFGQFPTFFLAPFAGVLADRVDRKRLLALTQILLMSQALLLAAMTITSSIQTWHVFLLTLMIGMINALDIPTKQSFISEMVSSREDLANAIALNSIVGNATRFIGPSVAGLLIAAFDEGACFLINGLSYLAMLASLWAIKLPPRERTVHSVHFFTELKEGIAYVYEFVSIKNVLMLLAIINLIGMPFMVLLPILAGEMLHGGPHTLGFLTGATGGGAVLAALWLASRSSIKGLLGIIALNAFLFGLSLVILSQSQSFMLSVVTLILTGFSMTALIAGSNTFIQTLVEERMLGRVMGFFTMTFMGMTPLGSLWAGLLAQKIGTQVVLVLSGAACCLGSLLFIYMVFLRRQKNGIYSEIKTR